MSEWIEQDHMDENHLYVHLKNPELLDLSIFDRLSNDDFCLPCMLTNEKTASMVYAIEGYIPLHDFLSQYVFEKEEGYIFLHQLFEQASHPIAINQFYLTQTTYLSLVLETALRLSWCPFKYQTGCFKRICQKNGWSTSQKQCRLQPFLKSLDFY